MWCPSRSPSSSSSPLSHRPQKQPLFAGERGRNSCLRAPCVRIFLPLLCPASVPPPFCPAFLHLKSQVLASERRTERKTFCSAPRGEKRTGYPCRANPPLLYSPCFPLLFSLINNPDNKSHPLLQARGAQGRDPRDHLYKQGKPRWLLPTLVHQHIKEKALTLVFGVNFPHQGDISLQIERQRFDRVQVILHIVR